MQATGLLKFYILQDTLEMDHFCTVDSGNAKYLLILRMIMLGAWVIWKHRNACVFEGASPSVQLNTT